MKENQSGFFKGFIVFMAKAILFLYLCGTTYFTFCYLTELPKLKAKAVAGGISAKTQSVIQKMASQEGKVFTVVEQGSTYITLKGKLLKRTIAPSDLADEYQGKLPPGTEKVVLRDGKYVPLIK